MPGTPGATAARSSTTGSAAATSRRGWRSSATVDRCCRAASGGRGVATIRQLADIFGRVRRGLERGALGVGIGLQYTPAATRAEVVETFRAAAAVRAPGVRPPAVVRLQGAGVQRGVVPRSDCRRRRHRRAAAHRAPEQREPRATPQTLALVEGARQRGLDVTTEAYPYSAGMTRIESALLDQFEGATDEFAAPLNGCRPASG